MNHPKPFLHRIFPEDIKPEITEGWIYGSEEAEIYGGFTDHQAVDFAVPTGTPVLAAADGLALASFYETPICYPDDQPRQWQGEPVFWGFGLFVYILHDNGWLTTYGHLHELASVLLDHGGYIEPTEEKNGDLIPPILNISREDIGTKYPQIEVKAGQLIGRAGITGMGMGQRTYDNWLAGKPYRVSDEEHVHFAVSTPPGPENDKAMTVDPFGIEGFAHQYPANDADWSTLPRSLWLK